MSDTTKAQPARLRSLRVPDPRWERAMAAAKRRGETLSVAINRFLDEYAEADEHAHV